MKPVFIASTPNAQTDDRRICWKLLFQPGKWKVGASEDNVKTQLSKLLKLKTCYTFDTGRAALYSALRAIGVNKSSEVIIQAFTCLAVPLGVKWTGARPVYADINSQTYNPEPLDIKKFINNRTRAVIVQHTFGIPAKIDEIKNIIDQENKKRTIQSKIYIIEDLAHSLGSSYKGKMLGQWGDIAMLSFGQDKVLSCTQGGAILTNDDLVKINLSHDYSKLTYVNNFSVFRNILHSILWNVINKTYYFPPVVSFGKMLILLFRFLGLFKNQADPKACNPETPYIHKLSNAQSIMLINQLKKLNKFNEHRKLITNIYEETFKQGYKGLSLLRYPIQRRNPDLIVKKIKSIRVIPGNWYNWPIYPKEVDLRTYNFIPGTCLTAKKTSSQIINLPTHIGTPENAARKLANLISH